MPALIATLSGHKAQSAAVLRAVQSRQAEPIPAVRPAESIPAALLESDPPGMAAAEDVPKNRIAAQERRMEQVASEEKTRAPLRRSFGRNPFSPGGQ